MPTPTSEFGDCACGKPSVVKVNDTPVCLEHLTETLSGIERITRQAFEDLGD